MAASNTYHTTELIISGAVLFFESTLVGHYTISSVKPNTQPDLYEQSGHNNLN